MKVLLWRLQPVLPGLPLQDHAFFVVASASGLRVRLGFFRGLDFRRLRSDFSGFGQRTVCWHACAPVCR
jgi:hypothetical protein